MTLLPWTSGDLRAWRGRLGWTQARAADALCYHLEAYKKLEAATRVIVPRIRRLCILTEREHVRALYSISGAGGQRQVFASPERVLSRIEALAREGRMADRHGKARLRYVSMFAGLESATAAFERLGSDALPVAFSETDAAANAVLRHRWPDVPRVGDITEFDWASLRGHVDLVLGGSPCQSFSVAGRRLGISDPRGNLALHFLRAIGAIQPQWFFYENVPGLLSANDGQDFETFLGAIEELGYACAWRVLDSRFFGLPQRRRRLLIIGERAGSGRGCCEILDLAEGKTGSSGTGREAWKTAAGRAEGCPGDLNQELAVDWSLASAWLEEREAEARADAQTFPAPAGLVAFKPMAGVGAGGTLGASRTESPTLAAASGGNRVPGIVYAADMRHCTLGAETMTLQVGPDSGWSVNAVPCAVQEGSTGWIVRRFSPLECLRLQGLDDDWLDGVRVAGRPLTDSDRYRLVGNAWSVPVAAWVLERLLAYVADERKAGQPVERQQKGTAVAA
jgi:DNA (cytosine-5)-methyltransferase 1